jgi:hypothetical protein
LQVMFYPLCNDAVFPPRQQPWSWQFAAQVSRSLLDQAVDSPSSIDGGGS